MGPIASRLAGHPWAITSARRYPYDYHAVRAPDSEGVRAMAAEPTALSTVPPSEPPADTDYDAICAAVTATARGRWFLDEFAKRNRNTDTTEVLAAIARMQAVVVGERTQQASRDAHQEVRIELL